MKSSLLIPVVLSESLTSCNEKSCTSKAELIKNLFESQAGKFRYSIREFKLLIGIYKTHFTFVVVKILKLLLVNLDGKQLL